MKQKLFTFLLAIVASVGTMNAQLETDELCYVFRDSIITRFIPPHTFKYDTICVFDEVTPCDTLYSGDIVIPATVEYKGHTYQVSRIGCGTFDGCTGLTSITCWAIIPPEVCPNTFEGVDCSQIPLYVPTESVGAYKAAYKWREFNPILPIGTQAIEQINKHSQANIQKQVKDGQLFIHNGNKTFTVHGQEVK